MQRRSFHSVAAFAAASTMLGAMASAIVIPTVPISNPGNAADPTTGFGSVAHAYNIGTTEVTNAQYAAFLNAVAATDTNNLYNTNMAGAFGGITRAGSPGLYTYSTVSGRANNPVNYVSVWDSTRFANWLHNGQTTGAQSASTTEDGAYTLTTGGIVANTVTRNANWQWALASEDEWYKAAYHQPATQGGDSNDYWAYATSSNTLNTTQANYNNAIGSITPAGSYAATFYGAFDMGGNVWEWNETIILASYRGLRGGSYDSFHYGLRGDFRVENYVPTVELNDIGFRVVQVPGPSSVALLGLSGLLVSRRRRS